MDRHVVTSCSTAGWALYGQRFVTSFIKHWPQDVVLHIVSEDMLPVTPYQAPHSGLPRKVVFWPLLRSEPVRAFLDRCTGAEGWKAGLAQHPRPPGIGKNWRDTSGYNFRFDAYKFSKKVFAIEMVASALGDDAQLYWIDADAYTHAPVPVELLDRVLPSTYALSCLARQGYHSECGFVGYNLKHSATRHFIQSFAALYHKDAVFQLAEWHDSWVFDWTRNKLQTATYGIPHKSKGHPFINSELGRYMDHLKGKRKDRGASHKSEQICHQTEPYWRDQVK